MILIKCACISDCGKYRKNNEDNILFNTTILPENHNDFNATEEILVQANVPVLFGVFDGMGGMSMGEKAAAIAAKRFGDIDAENCTGTNLCNELAKASREIAQKAGLLKVGEMGTTAALVCIHNREMLAANVGDSRIYLKRDETLYQMSKDHTDAELLKELNITHRKPSLTQFLGMSEEITIEPHLIRCEIDQGDKILICSDGLNEKISDEELYRALSVQSDAVQILNDLIDEARKREAKDNITAILLMAEQV